MGNSSNKKCIYGKTYDYNGLSYSVHRVGFDYYFIIYWGNRSSPTRLSFNNINDARNAAKVFIDNGGDAQFIHSKYYCTERLLNEDITGRERISNK